MTHACMFLDDEHKVLPCFVIPLTEQSNGQGNQLASILDRVSQKEYKDYDTKMSVLYIFYSIECLTLATGTSERLMSCFEENNIPPFK